MLRPCDSVRRGIAFLVLASAAMGAWPSPVPAAPPISGIPYLLDGDTLGFADVRVRLYGIDAPEPDQTCRMLGVEAPIGAWATATLRRLIGHHDVTCHAVTRPTAGQVLGRCRTAAVPDLGRALVAAGFAWDFERQGHGIYADAEAEARQRRLGIWAGEAECPPPWTWRRR